MSKIRYKALEQPLKMLYKVEISEKTLEKETTSLRLFEIDIVPEKVSFWSGNQNIEIVRKPSMVSGIPDNSVDAFVQQIAVALHQLTFKLGFNGMPVCVEKQDELWRKWLTIRSNIADSYTGDWVDKALCEIDQKMLPSDQLTQNIMQDLFLNEYFRNVYDFAFVEDQFKRRRTVYGLCPLPLQFIETWTRQSSTEGQMISFSGRCNESSNTSDFKNWLKTKTNDQLSQISVNGSYQINSNTGWCNALDSSYSLVANNSYEKTIKVTLTTN
ncbi:hypothetical protein [Pedobacter caeni]|uniref:Uncharacterized protein n=1 Tax=Pedobacter caeni TaxID=288992 RepID=A0A1M5BB27_9SPHI|nr:hypothetical protein [Pedobacter caeni]SHF39625.1 hypothetical protein SAMN04488522_1021111 [Pedobacter caeni]